MFSMSRQVVNFHIETNLVEHNRFSIDVINWLGKKFDEHIQTKYK